MGEGEKGFKKKGEDGGNFFRIFLLVLGHFEIIYSNWFYYSNLITKDYTRDSYLGEKVELEFV